MRVETPTRELHSVEWARKQLEELDFWKEDELVQGLDLVAMPEVSRTRVGFHKGDKTLPILDRGGLKRHLGLTSQVIEEFESDPDLLTRIIRHCLNKRVGQLARFTGHRDGVTSITEPVGAWIPPLTVFDLVAEELKGQVELIGLRRKSLVIRFVSEYMTQPPKKAGDLIHAGLTIKMNGRLLIGPYSLRLSCMNGASHAYEALQAADTMDIVQREVRNLCQAQHETSRQLTDAWVALDEQPFGGNREQTFLRVARQNNVPRRLIDAVLARLPELPEDATMFDMMNIATQIASDARRPERAQASLGSLINHLTHEVARCDHCGVELPKD